MTKNYILFFLQLIRFGVKNVSPFKFLDKEPQIIFLFRKERDSTTILIVITFSKQKKTQKTNGRKFIIPLRLSFRWRHYALIDYEKWISLRWREPTHPVQSVTLFIVLTAQEAT